MDNLLWPINRAQSLELLNYFCKVMLPRFGKYQDAMTGKLRALGQDRGWSLYHSRISFALNAKMISPRCVVDTAIEAYHQSQGVIDIAQIEGFVRQILGWREFIRGVYWANMPNYSSLNYSSRKVRVITVCVITVCAKLQFVHKLYFVQLQFAP